MFSPWTEDDGAVLVRHAEGMSDDDLSAAQFRALYDRVKHMSRREPADRRGALNNIAPAQVTVAAGGVQRGRAVSLEAPIDTEVALDNPDPAVHQMIQPAIDPVRAPGLSFAMDRVAMNIHGNADSHIDALSHVIFDGTLYNGVGAERRHRDGGNRAVHRGGQRRDRRSRPAARHPASATGVLAGAG